MSFFLHLKLAIILSHHPARHPDRRRAGLFLFMFLRSEPARAVEGSLFDPSRKPPKPTYHAAPYLSPPQSRKPGDFVATTRVNRNPALANNARNSSSVRSRPPGNNNILYAQMLIIYVCFSFPFEITVSTKLTFAFFGASTMAALQNRQRSLIILVMNNVFHDVSIAALKNFPPNRSRAGPPAPVFESPARPPPPDCSRSNSTPLISGYFSNRRQHISMPARHIHQCFPVQGRKNRKPPVGAESAPR